MLNLLLANLNKLYTVYIHYNHALVYYEHSENRSANQPTCLHYIF